MAHIIWNRMTVMLSISRGVVTAALVFGLLGGGRLHAGVINLVVEHREALPNRTQPYEKLTGRFYGELDPKNPLNALITDLEFTPRNARGMVEYSATFTI